MILYGKVLESTYQKWYPLGDTGARLAPAYQIVSKSDSPVNFADNVHHGKLHVGDESGDRPGSSSSNFNWFERSIVIGGLP